jgi:hypothetical protein
MAKSLRSVLVQTNRLLSELARRQQLGKETRKALLHAQRAIEQELSASHGELTDWEPTDAGSSRSRFDDESSGNSNLPPY